MQDAFFICNPNYTLLCHIRLSTSGIVEIEMAENRRLMRLFETWQKVLAHARWIEQMTPRISTLISDLAAMSERFQGLANLRMVREMAADVAILKDKMDLPDDYSRYGADNFLDPDESDVGNNEFYARVEEGIRFPFAGQSEQQLDLFNPYASEVKNHNGFILPAYKEVLRLAVSGYSGSLNIGQYQYQTHENKMGTRSVTRFRYGPVRTVCSNSAEWKTRQYNFVSNVFEGPAYGFELLSVIENSHANGDGHRYFRYREYWRDTYNEPYWYVDTQDHAINGSQIAQTFLSAQAGWLTKIGLFFPKRSVQGMVHLHLCETDLGMPDPSRSIARTSVDAANLVAWLGETPFVFQEPVFLSPGKLYALVITTSGDHDIALVQGTEYTQGTIFQSTDGYYFQGDFSKDLMMNFYYAQFANPRTTVELESIQLEGGICDIDILAPMTIPSGTDIVFEYQKNGHWYAIGQGTADELLGLPALLPLRVVFIGTADIMPGLGLVGSRIKAGRPAVTFRHISTERILPDTCSEVEVILLLEGWNPDKHTCSCSLRTESGTVNGTLESEENVLTGGHPGIQRFYKFEVQSASSYKIEIEGSSTTALEIFHVSKRTDVAI